MSFRRRADDDIAGADGVNAAISRNYTINYLDQAHLYNIVDAHIFPNTGNRACFFTKFTIISGKLCPV